MSVFAKSQEMKLAATLKVKEPLSSDATIDKLYADCDWMAIGDPDMRSKSEKPLVFKAGEDSLDVEMAQVDKLEDYVYDYAETARFWRGTIK